LGQWYNHCTVNALGERDDHGKHEKSDEVPPKPFLLLSLGIFSDSKCEENDVSNTIDIEQ